MVRAMTSPSHHDRALAHLEAARASNDALADIYARGNSIDRGHIAELHAQVRLGVKLAQVEALLAIGQRLERFGLDREHLDRIAEGRA